MKPFDEELVSGSITRSMWKLAWPGVALNLVNGIHGLVDHILVGHFVDAPHNAANAAIGVAWQVFLVVVVFLASLFHGTSVLVARYAGRQNRAMMNNVAYQTFITMIWAVVFIVAPAGYFLAPTLLDIVNASPEVRHHALPYLRILFTLSGPVFINILVTYAFQASGDPRTPLKLGILSTALNVSVSTVLILGLGPIPALGAAGAALGTCLAPIPSLLIAIAMIGRGQTILGAPPRYTLIPDFRVVGRVARIGIPTGLQAVLLNVGGVFLLRVIGTLEHSAAAQAAYVICYSQLFQLVAWASMGLRSASSTLIGQNIGAGKPDRGKTGVDVAARMGATFAAAFSLAYWFLPVPLLQVFGAADDPIVRDFGVSLLQFLAGAGICLAVSQSYTGGLIGAGDTKKPMYIAFFSQIMLLLGMCYTFLALGILRAELIWLSILVSHAARMVLSYSVFNRGAWRHIRVEFEH